ASLVNLFIARALSQVRQTAVRLAIGGSWRQLLRLQLVETALLAMLAVGLGLAIAAPTTTISRSLIFPGVVWARPVLDVRGAAIGFGLACFVSTVTTFWNALYTMRVNPTDLLRASASASTGTPRHTHAVRRTLVMVQASILVVLLSGTVAFVLSLRRASHADLGFDITALVAVRFPLPAETPPERVNALYREARDRVARVPGVESAALAYMEPWRNNANVDFSVPGATALEPPVTLFDLASPEYLHTFGIAMRSGRWFEQADNPSAAPVVVVNESFANNYWPRGDGLGQCLRVGGASAPCRTLVGIVRDFHVTGQLDGTIYPTIIVPVAQGTGFRQTPHLFIRVRGDRSTVMSSARRALQIMEPNLPALDVHPVENNASAFFASLKLGAAAFSAFGVLSAVIAALGLHSVLSLLIVERRRIYAIRLALGATPASLARAVGFYATATVVTGLLIGGAVLIPIARVIEPILFHTKLLAVASLVGVSTLAMIIAIGAVVGPVRTMFRTDVMTVLREQ
ncbi:MAG TPA: ABC transporter permease, partial [Gemmatimonadaceae bacterium]|nr:ABC transporter permease [Gemmatimonadaceae bacterium]